MRHDNDKSRAAALVARLCLAAALCAGCGRTPPPPARSPGPATAAAPLLLAGDPGSRFSWGASLLPSDAPPDPAAAGLGLRTSVLFVDFAAVRRSAGLLGKLHLKFDSADLAVRLGLAAESIQAAWVLECAGEDPDSRPATTQAIVVRTEKPEQIDQRLSELTRSGHLAPGPEGFFVDDRSRLLLGRHGDAAVIAMSAGALAWLRDTWAGRHPRFTEAPGAQALLDACGPDARTVFLTSNPRYRRLAMLGPGLQLSASAVSSSERRGAYAFADEASAREGAAWLGLQAEEEADRAVVRRAGAIVRMTAALEPERSVPVPSASLDPATAAAEGLPWLRQGRTHTLAESPAGETPRGRPGELAAAAGLVAGDILLVHAYAAAGGELENLRFSIAPTQRAREALASRAREAGWKSERQGPLEAWVDDRGGAWAGTRNHVLWGRTAGDLREFLVSRFGESRLVSPEACAEAMDLARVRALPLKVARTAPAGDRTSGIECEFPLDSPDGHLVLVLCTSTQEASLRTGEGATRGPWLVRRGAR